MIEVHKAKAAATNKPKGLTYTHRWNVVDFMGKYHLSRFENKELPLPGTQISIERKHIKSKEEDFNRFYRELKARSEERIRHNEMKMKMVEFSTNIYFDTVIGSQIAASEEILNEREQIMNSTNKRFDSKAAIQDFSDQMANGKHHYVSYAIRNGFNSINYSDPDTGDTFLHIAARNGYPKVVEELLLYRADPDVKNHEGDYPVHLCWKFWNFDKYRTKEQRENQENRTCDLLYNFFSFGAFINATNLDGQTCLHLACKYNNVRIVKLLLFFRADCLLSDRQGNTPLTVAERSGHRNVYGLVRMFMALGSTMVHFDFALLWGKFLQDAEAVLVQGPSADKLLFELSMNEKVKSISKELKSGGMPIDDDLLRKSYAESLSCPYAVKPWDNDWKGFVMDYTALVKKEKKATNFSRMSSSGTSDADSTDGSISLSTTRLHTAGGEAMAAFTANMPKSRMAHRRLPLLTPPEPRPRSSYTANLESSSRSMFQHMWSGSQDSFNLEALPSPDKESAVDESGDSLGPMLRVSTTVGRRLATRDGSGSAGDVVSNSKSRMVGRVDSLGSPSKTTPRSDEGNNFNRLSSRSSSGDNPSSLHTTPRSPGKLGNLNSDSFSLSSARAQTADAPTKDKAQLFATGLESYTSRKEPSKTATLAPLPVTNSINNNDNSNISNVAIMRSSASNPNSPSKIPSKGISSIAPSIESKLGPIVADTTTVAMPKPTVALGGLEKFEAFSSKFALIDGELPVKNEASSKQLKRRGSAGDANAMHHVISRLDSLTRSDSSEAVVTTTTTKATVDVPLELEVDGSYVPKHDRYSMKERRGSAGDANSIDAINTIGALVSARSIRGMAGASTRGPRAASASASTKVVAKRRKSSEDLLSIKMPTQSSMPDGAPMVPNSARRESIKTGPAIQGSPDATAPTAVGSAAKSRSSSKQSIKLDPHAIARAKRKTREKASRKESMKQQQQQSQGSPPRNLLRALSSRVGMFDENELEEENDGDKGAATPSEAPSSARTPSLTKTTTWETIFEEEKPIDSANKRPVSQLQSRNIACARAVCLDGLFEATTKRPATSSNLMISHRKPQARLRETEEESSIIRAITSQGKDFDAYETSLSLMPKQMKMLQMEASVEKSVLGEYEAMNIEFRSKERDALFSRLASRPPTQQKLVGTGTLSRPATSLASLDSTGNQAIDADSASLASTGTAELPLSPPLSPARDGLGTPSGKKKPILHEIRRSKIDLVNNKRARFVDQKLLPPSRVASVVEKMAADYKAKTEKERQRKLGLTGASATRVKNELAEAIKAAATAGGVDRSGAKTPEMELRGQDSAALQAKASALLAAPVVKYGRGRLTSTHMTKVKLEDPWSTVAGR